MKFNADKSTRNMAIVVSGTLLVACLSYLGCEHLVWLDGYRAEREALQQAEIAARDDAEAAAQLAKLVERQTSGSLRRQRRRQIAGVVALVAAGGTILGLRPPATAKPSLPRTVADSLTQRRSMTERRPAASEPHHGDDPPTVAVDLNRLAEIVDREGREAHHLMPLLHAIQAEYGYLPDAAVAELCRLTKVTPPQVAGVASFYPRFRTKPCGRHLIEVCCGTACHVAGADRVVDELRRGLDIATGRDTDPAGVATVATVGCLGCCDLAPAVQQDEQLLANVRVEDIPEIIDQCQDREAATGSYKPAKGVVLRQSRATAVAEVLRRHGEVGPRVITEDWAIVRGGSLEDYERQGGFAAMAKVLSRLTPEEIIAEVERSQLRGRGGGGFPTAKKWRLFNRQVGDVWVIANGDEGDPGAYMDRSIMEAAPASVVEGMVIAARAVGAKQGIIYVRNEYPVAARRLRETVRQMREKGYLGKNLLGSHFSFDVEVVEGGGAFVCGEETALIESIEGRRGTPHLRPPYPAERGLWGQPTLTNNVETLASLPWIVRHGGNEFAAVGSAASRGTKIFSLAGKVKRGGLVEAPMGTTIAELVQDYGGGVPSGRKFKAVQIGGPSGGCLPAELADTPVDYEALRDLGAIMGSGGIVVLDDTDCMVDVARYFLEFTQKESCGHCTFCRVGTRKLLDLLERVTAGKANLRDLDEIESLATSVVQGSLCGLGKTAPNPVLTTLRYFRDEYEAHLAGCCPAGRCKALVAYQVTTDCVGCTLCAQHCPASAIEATPYRQHRIDSTLCTRCDACRTTCPEQAIVAVSPVAGRSHRSLRRKTTNPQVA